MKDVEEIKRRFDDTFKILLIISSVTMSYSIVFYKETLGIDFFIEFVSSYILALLMWAFSNLIDGEEEYLFKLGAWHLITFTLITSFVRLISGIIKINLLLGILCLATTAIQTTLIKIWLEKNGAIPSSEYNLLSRHFTLIIGFWTAFQITNMIY